MENSEPKFTTIIDNTTVAVPKTASPKVENPKLEMKEDIDAEKPSVKEKSLAKNYAKEIDMTEVEDKKRIWKLDF